MIIDTPHGANTSHAVAADFDTRARGNAWSCAWCPLSVDAMAVLKSVNVGVPRTNPWKTVTVTGIDKRPVAGPVAVCAHLTTARPGGEGRRTQVTTCN